MYMYIVKYAEYQTSLIAMNNQAQLIINLYSENHLENQFQYPCHLGKT